MLGRVLPSASGQLLIGVQQDQRIYFKKIISKAPKKTQTLLLGSFCCLSQSVSQYLVVGNVALCVTGVIQVNCTVILPASNFYQRRLRIRLQTFTPACLPAS